MTTYTDRDGREVELPKLTMALSRRMDLSGKQGETRIRAMLDVLRDLLPEDYLAEVLDGERLEDVDLAALEATYAGVSAAYHSASLAASLSLLDSLDLDRLTKVVETVQGLDRQGFKRVR